jgi:hypothetical protein
MEAPALNLVPVQTDFHIDVGLPCCALEVEFIPGVAPGHPKADRGNHTPRFELIRNEVPCRCVGEGYVPIPAMPITHSDLMAITIPSDADHRRSEATLGCSYHAEVIGIRQAFCC